MIGNFFKGFFSALGIVLIICFFGWVFKFLFDLAVSFWGFVFGWTLPGILVLLICIAVGIYFCTKKD